MVYNCVKVCHTKPKSLVPKNLVHKSLVPTSLVPTSLVPSSLLPKFGTYTFGTYLQVRYLINNCRVYLVEALKKKLKSNLELPKLSHSFLS